MGDEKIFKLKQNYFNDLIIHIKANATDTDNAKNIEGRISEFKFNNNGFVYNNKQYKFDYKIKNILIYSVSTQKYIKPFDEVAYFFENYE